MTTLKFGYFLGYFSKIVKKPCLNRFIAWLLELWCKYFWLLGGLWCGSLDIFKLLWCRSFGFYKNLATFCSNFLAVLPRIIISSVTAFSYRIIKQQYYFFRLQGSCVVVGFVFWVTAYSGVNLVLCWYGGDFMIKWWFVVVIV